MAFSCKDALDMAAYTATASYSVEDALNVPDSVRAQTV